MNTRISGLICILFACTFLAIGAQESDPSRDDASEAQTESAAQKQDTEESSQTQKQEETSDDVFDPSEDISEDYAVPYPTDI